MIVIAILVVRHIFSENKMNEQGYRVSELYTGKDKGIYGKKACLLIKEMIER